MLDGQRARQGLGLVLGLLMVVACGPAPAPPAAAPTRGSEGSGSASAAPTVAAASTAPGGASVSQAAPAAPISQAAPGAPAPQAAPAPLSPPVDVKVAIFGTLADAPFYVAIERGYFRDEGLNVETIASDSAPRIIPFLAAGQIDVAGLSQSPALFNAVGRGVPIRLVGDKGRLSPNYDYAALVVRKDLVDEGRVRDYADLRGMRISTPGQGTALWAQLARVLDLGGMWFGDIEAETLSQPDSLPALANRALDAALLIEPFVTAAVGRGIGVRWKGAQEFAPNAQNGEVAYAPSFIESQPEAARRFMVAYLKGLRAYQDAFDSGTDKEAMIDILIKHSPVKDRAVYYTMVPAGFELNGRINVDFLRAEQEIYGRAGLLTDPVDVTTLVDHQYADYAVARLGRR